MYSSPRPASALVIASFLLAGKLDPEEKGKGADLSDDAEHWHVLPSQSDRTEGVSTASFMGVATGHRVQQDTGLVTGLHFFPFSTCLSCLGSHGEGRSLTESKNFLKNGLGFLWGNNCILSSMKINE